MPNTLRLVERRMGGLANRIGEALRSYTIGPMSLKDPALAAFFGAGRSTSAGITVSDEMAFTMSAVFCAVDNLSSDVAKPPLVLRKRNQNGGSDDFVGAKLYRLMKERPNPDMTSFTFRKTLIAHALTCHGGFAEIERDGAGMPAALWILTPNRVEPFIDKIALPNGRYRGRLKYRIDGGKTTLDSADVIHIHGLGYDGYTGYSIIDKARQAIGLALAAERFGASFFGNGAVFGGVVATDQQIGPDKEEELRKQVNEYHGSSDKAHRLLFLSGGWKYTKTGVAPNEAQMDELRDKQCMEVARFFNFPLYKLKVAVAGAQSFASNEQADLDYFKGPLLTWYVNCEQEFNSKLLPEHSSYGSSFFKHNMTAFMRGDAAGRTSLYTALLDRGVYCADDVLEMEDLNPQPGGQGKLFLVQGAMVPKDQLAEVVQAGIDKKKQPKPQPPPPTPAPTPDPNARALEDALTRATAAGELAAAAVTEARQEREARIALEATGTANTAEIARLVVSEQALFARAMDLEGVAAEKRAEADSLRAAGVLREAELEECRAVVVIERASVATLTAERDTAVAARDAQLLRLNELSETLATAEGDLAARGAELEAARQAWSVLNQRCLELDAQLTASRTAQDALQVEQVRATEAAARAESERLAAERRSAEAEGGVVEARATVSKCLEDVARIAQEQQSDRSAREASERLAAEAVEARVAAEGHAEAVRQEAAQAVLLAEQARVDAATASQALTAARSRIEELETAERQAVQDRQAAVDAYSALDVSRVAAVEEASKLTAAIQAIEGEREALRQSVADAEAGRVAALEAVSRAEASLLERESAMSVERSTAETQRAELEQRLAQQVEEVARLDRERQEAESARDATAARLAAAEEARSVAVNESATALAEAEVARADLVRQLAEQTAIVATRERERQEVSAAREATVRELRTAEESRSAVQVESAAAIATATERQAELARQVAERDTAMAELQRQLVEVRGADARGVASVIAAHRALVVETMRGIIDWETERLRNAQATPEKLRAKMGTFYDGFTDLVRRRLEPVLAVHLAFVRSDDDPREEARRLAEAHVRESQRQLETVLDGEQLDAYPGSATAMWHRWEAERSTQIADALMARELNYVRQR